MLVEINHEYLILWIAGARKCHRGANYVRALMAHASTVVDYQPSCDGDIFVTERFNLLQDFIFINLEVFLGESGDRSASVISYACPQDNQVYIRSNCVQAHLVSLWDALILAGSPSCVRTSK